MVYKSELQLNMDISKRYFFIAAGFLLVAGLMIWIYRFELLLSLPIKWAVVSQNCLYGEQIAAQYFDIPEDLVAENQWKCGSTYLADDPEMLLFETYNEELQQLYLLNGNLGVFEELDGSYLIFDVEYDSLIRLEVGPGIYEVFTGKLIFSTFHRCGYTVLFLAQYQVDEEVGVNVGQEEVLQYLQQLHTRTGVLCKR